MLRFVPWGFLGPLYFRKGYGFAVCILGGIAMSVLIETFQLFLGIFFDLGDVLTNSLGTLAGCLLCAPIFLRRARARDCAKGRGRRGIRAY